MRFASLSLASLLIACGSNPDPAPPSIVVNQSSLRSAIGAPYNVDVVGVTVDPTTQKRYVLDSERGIFELVDDGARQKLSLEELVYFDSFPQSEFTDFAAIGNDTFAVTAMNDGFALDLVTKTLRRYFCYVPGIVEDEFPQAVQLTNSVTFDPEASLLYVQPQTFEDRIDNGPMMSQIGQFTLDGGEGFNWLDIDDEDFLAGGIVKVSSTAMMMGSESTLYTYDMQTSTLEETLDLKSIGITKIDALARDPVTGNVLVVDADSDDLFELDLP